MTRVIGHGAGKSGGASALRAAIRIFIRAALLGGMAAGSGAPYRSQTASELQNFLQEKIGLSEEELVDVRSGQAIAKSLSPRTHREVFLFGVVYAHAAPEAYLAFARDFESLRNLPTIWRSK